MATFTVKASGGDYSSLNAWEAARQGVLSEVEAAECYAFEDTTAVAIDGWTTSAANYIRIYTPTAERHAGIVGAATGYRLRASAAFSRAFDVVEEYTRIEGLVIRNTSVDGEHCARVNAASATADIRFTECVIEQGASSGCIGLGLGGGTGLVRNCIIGGGSADIAVDHFFNASSPTYRVYNCTIYAGATGLNHGGGTMTATNCYVNATTPYAGTITRTTCAHSGAGSFSGSTANVDYSTSTGARFTSITGGSENLHIGADSALRGVGTDLSADGSYPFSIDIDGTTRSGGWSIGADDLFVTPLPSFRTERPDPTSTDGALGGFAMLDVRAW